MKIGNFSKIVKTENSFENCSYLCRNKNNIYSVVEYSSNPEYSNGCLITRNSNLSPICKNNIIGKSPCYITLDKLRNLLYISNYESGSIEFFSLTSKGIIDKLIYHKSYYNNSHIHCIALSEDNTVLFVIDLGNNTLFAYEILFENSKLELKEINSYIFPNASNPRHLAINKNNIYVITENSCELYHLIFSKQTGFSLVNNTSVFAPNVKKQETDTGCAIKLTNDNKYIYVTIRGNNSISVFNSSLEFVQNISCYGETPRDINFDASQNILFCANQNSSNISIFERNKETGYLLFKSKYPVESPACIIL